MSKPVDLIPEDVKRLLTSPACLRGRAWARRKAAEGCAIESDDYRSNISEAIRLEILGEIGQAPNGSVLG